MTLPSQDITLETQSGVARLTLNRPEKRNALSHSLLTRIDEALRTVADDRGVQVLVIAATGPAFCAGHDLSEMVGCSEDAYYSLFSLCSTVMQRLRALPQPVIARVHGLATAAGCQLVAACDLAVAAESATFATPGIKIGLFCTTPMVPLVRAIAPKPALEMLLTGRPISAARAYELGLVNRVVPVADLDTAVQDLVDAILVSSPQIIQMGKVAFYDQLGLDEDAAYERATDVMVENAMQMDAQEGMQAFLQKRKPKWGGA